MCRAESPPNNREILKFDLFTFAFFRSVYPYLRPYQKKCILALTALFAVHVVDAAIPFCLKIGIDTLAKNESNISLPILSIIALAILRYVMLNFGRSRIAKVSIDLSCAIRQALYVKLMTLGRGFYARISLGDLMARGTNDIAHIQSFFRFGLHQFLSLFAVALIAPVVMVQQSLELTLLLLPLLLAMSGSAWYLAGRIRLSSNLSQNTYGILTEALQQNLKGISTIQSHGQEDRETQHVAGISVLYASTVLQLVRWNAILNGTMVLGSGLIILALIEIGGSQVQSAQMTIGALTAFILYLTMVLGVVKNSSFPIYALLNASTAMKRVSQIMDERPEILDTKTHTSSPPIKGNISVHNLSFRYPTASKLQATLVLDDISLTVQSGEIVAIIGPIGAGKSTLLRMLARQLEPIEGYVSLDGHDIKTISVNHLRKTISFAIQDGFLFATSVSENISFDDPDRAPEHIVTTARIAQLDATIKGLNAGLSTPVGERGVTLSGGQRQKINLARALIRQTPILLLDNSFSAIDTEASALILSQLKFLQHRPTIVMATHNVFVAQQADRIFVMERGRIVEVGNHDELVIQGGYYANLIRTQHEQIGRAHV
jgi:ATP-binding cassette subfamily B multidrug efflux pump